MLPVWSIHLLLHVFPLRKCVAALALLLALLVDAVPSMAQTAPNPEAAASGPGQPIDFEADSVAYSDDTESVTASGSVVLRRDGKSAKADSVTWSKKTGKIVASGNIRRVE